MPDSCAVTSGTLRNWRLCASCPWRAGKRTGCRRKSISTACTRRWKTLPPSSGKRIWSPYSVRIPAVWRSDHVGRQYGGRKRVPLLERIHGWRTGAGLSQCSSVSIRLISLERPHSCWKFVNGDWKEIGIHAEWVLQILLRKSFGILYGIQAASGMFRVQFLCKRVEKDLPLSAFRKERKAGAQPEELIFS